LEGLFEITKEKATVGWEMCTKLLKKSTRKIKQEDLEALASNQKVLKMFYSGMKKHTETYTETAKEQLTAAFSQVILLMQMERKLKTGCLEDVWMFNPCDKKS